MFTIGNIHRGKGKSSASVLPADLIFTEDLHEQIAEARQIIMKIDALDPLSNFQHHYFGQLDRNDAKRFIKIHTNHHLKIIRDIIGQSSKDK